MIQDLLAASAFGLAACAFGALIFVLRRSAPDQNHLESLVVADMGPPSKEVMSLQSEMESLHSHIRISEELRGNLQAKLEASSEVIAQLNLNLENQKKSVIFKENSWLQDRTHLEAKLSAGNQEVLSLTEKVKSLEDQIVSLQLKPVPPDSSLQRAEFSKKVLASKASSPAKAHERPEWYLQPDKERGAHQTQWAVPFPEVTPRFTKTLHPVSQNTISSREHSHSDDSLRVEQLNLMVKTLQGKKAMLEERNQNWEVALRYLSEHILRNYGKNYSSFEIGPLVATALQSINKSLIMNDMFQANHDEIDDLNVLSELLYEGKEPSRNTL
ncbi:MAG: hypothetical protein WCI18_15775 [Pseudomonadota bacterium]